MNDVKQIVINALSTVKDPDLGKDLVSLGMIKDLKVSDKNCTFTVELTTPACPLKEKIKADCVQAVSSVLDQSYNIEVSMSANTTSSLNFSKSDIMKQVKNIVAVASGKGGVGKSTVACNIAIGLSNAGAKVGLLDADIFGPSQPILFGCTAKQPKFEKSGDKSIIMPIEKYGVKLMSIGFLAPENAAIVWRGPMASSALKQFATDVNWGALDYLIIDLPPGTSDIHLTVTQGLPLTGALIVTTPQRVALSDVKKGIAMFRQEKINVPILGIVENMAYFTPEELPNNKYYIFGEHGGKELAQKYDIPLLGEIPLIQSIRESGDKGTPLLNQEKENPHFKDVINNLVRQISVKNTETLLIPDEKIN